MNPTQHRTAGRATAIKATGLSGCGFSALAIILLALALGAGAGGMGGTVPLAIAAGAVAVVGIVLLVISWRLLAISDDADRPQRDPVEPEVTAEEERRYRIRFRTSPRQRRVR